MSGVRNFAKETLWQTRAYALAARVRPWRGVAVLTYHGVRDATNTRAGTFEELHVRRDVLEGHLRVVRSVGTPISLDDWRRARAGSGSLPPRAVLVTFDDGYRSVQRFALPLLQQFDVPAVCFVCTGPSRAGELLWYDALERANRAAEVEPAKQLPYDEWQRLTSACRTKADPGDERAVLSPDDIAELARHPLVEIGAHTVDHPILARASVTVQHQQIARSLAELRDWTGCEVRAFAYPNGQPDRDFTADTVDIVRSLGCDVAFTTEPRMATSHGAMLECPRFTMLDSMSDARLAQYLTLSWQRAAS
jgi:peptidoglycan/xylan/chitin deacetylase (PgdA/CDA1 family)